MCFICLSTQLPTAFNLATLCASTDQGTTSRLYLSVDPPLPSGFSGGFLVDPGPSGTETKSTATEFSIQIAVPNSMAVTLLPNKLKLTRTVLKMSVNRKTRATKLTGTAMWATPHGTMSIALKFNTTAGSVCVSAETPVGKKLNIAGLLPLMANDFSLLAQELDKAETLKLPRADQASFKLFMTSKPSTRAYLRVYYKSIKIVTANLLGEDSSSNDGIQKALKAAKLDTITVNNLEILITNEGKGPSLRVIGSPVLGGLKNLRLNLQVEAFHIGSPDFAAAFGLTVRRLVLIWFRMQIYFPLL